MDRPNNHFLPTVNLLGVQISLGTQNFFLNRIVDSALRHENFFVCFVNVHQLMECEVNQALKRANTLAKFVLADGFPVALSVSMIARSRQRRIDGPGFVEKLLLRLSGTDISVRFVGGDAQGVLRLKSICERRYPKLTLKPSVPTGIITITNDSNIHGDRPLVDILRRDPADVTLVCLGCPKQEIWMMERTPDLPGIYLGVGAAIDFLSGNKRRAPYLFRLLGLEWLFRLCQEPKRLFKRYWSSNTRFIAKVVSLNFLRIVIRGQRKP